MKLAQSSRLDVKKLQTLRITSVYARYFLKNIRILLNLADIAMQCRHLLCYYGAVYFSS